MFKAFKRQTLQELLWADEIDGLELVDTFYVSRRRWSENRQMVFRFEGKHYRADYSVGLTELQDEQPFSYAPDEVQCEEVEQVEQVVKVWIPCQS